MSDKERAYDMQLYLWHNLKDNPDDLPTITSWYVVKVRSSDDLRIVYGYENVIPDKFDAWMKVDCPF